MGPGSKEQEPGTPNWGLDSELGLPLSSVARRWAADPFS